MIIVDMDEIIQAEEGSWALGPVTVREGGAGSGNWGHSGRPGVRGGSGGGGGHHTLLDKKCPLNNPIAIEICKRLTTKAEAEGLFRAEAPTSSTPRRNRTMEGMSHEERVDRIMAENVKFRGKTTPEQVALVRAEIDKIPDAHLEVIKAVPIQIVKSLPKAAHPATGESINPAGLYYHKTSMQSSRIQVKDVYIQHALNHEIGHAVYDRLKPSSQDTWTGFWRNSPSGMPTQYARSNASEGFAECYKHFATKSLRHNLMFGVYDAMESLFKTTSQSDVKSWVPWTPFGG